MVKKTVGAPQLWKGRRDRESLERGGLRSSLLRSDTNYLWYRTRYIQVLLLFGNFHFLVECSGSSFCRSLVLTSQLEQRRTALYWLVCGCFHLWINKIIIMTFGIRTCVLCKRFKTLWLHVNATNESRLSIGLQLTIILCSTSSFSMFPLFFIAYNS